MNQFANVAEASTDCPALQWRVHLLRQQPRKLVVLAMVLVIGCSCVWLMFSSVLPVLAAAGLLVGSSLDYLLPITYRLDSDGASARTLIADTRLGWGQVRYWRSNAWGIRLSPVLPTNRLSPFRGLYVRFGSAPDEFTIRQFVASMASAEGIANHDTAAGVAQ
ncbi:MAG: hypothetical protein KGJ62_10570 [Armatimonadetes bacterium]|nr:hypothetical protein [Armatimonadota bacterium]MDE2207143.1 hypothetical protein [Armatimonadota bacterium]